MFESYSVFRPDLNLVSQNSHFRLRTPYINSIIKMHKIHGSNAECRKDEKIWHSCEFLFIFQKSFSAMKNRTNKNLFAFPQTLAIWRHERVGPLFCKLEKEVNIHNGVNQVWQRSDYWGAGVAVAEC